MTEQIKNNPSPSTPLVEASSKKRKWVALIGLTVVVAAGSAALLVNIMERKQEARNPFFRVVPLTEKTIDPAIWGKNFPGQYDGYRRTVDQVRTRYGGSEALPLNYARQGQVALRELRKASSPSPRPE